MLIEFVFDRHFHHVYCEETERGKQQVNMAKQGFLPILLKISIEETSLVNNTCVIL